MKKTKKILLTALSGAVTASAFAPAAAYADFFIHTWQNHHTEYKLLDAQVDFLWYNTSTNIDSTGASYNPSGLNSYQRGNLDLMGSYGLSAKLSAFARLNFEMSKVDSTNAAASTGSTLGMGDQTVGLNYCLLHTDRGMDFDLQAQADLPAYSNDPTANPAGLSPVLGDASVDLTVGGFFSLPIAEQQTSTVRLTAGAGYTHRSNSFSASVPWSAAAELAPKRDGLVLGFEAFGIRSLNTDTHPNGASFANTSLGSLATGGSYVTNAIDPSFIALGGTAGYRTESDLEFTGMVAQTVWGRSAPSGFTLGFGLKTHFFGAERGPKDPVLQDQSRYGKSNRGYVNYGLEAKVLRANDRFNLVKIDKGADQGVSIGDTFDIFMTNPNGTPGPAIARGVVTSVKGPEAAIRIDEYYREVWIEEGFVARRPIQ